MNRYEKGFITKCAEYGIDGRKLLEKMAKPIKPIRLTENPDYDRYMRNPITDYFDKLNYDRSVGIQHATEDYNPYSSTTPPKYNWYHAAMAPWTLKAVSEAAFPEAPKQSVRQWGNRIAYTRNMNIMNRAMRKLWLEGMKQRAARLSQPKQQKTYNMPVPTGMQGR